MGMVSLVIGAHAEREIDAKSAATIAETLIAFMVPYILLSAHHTIVLRTTPYAARARVDAQVQRFASRGIGTTVLNQESGHRQVERDRESHWRRLRPAAPLQFIREGG